MIETKIVPLSVNRAWKGRRFKTDDYERYEKSLFYLLPENIVIPEGNLEIYLHFGFSSNESDWDNPIKPFQDVLQKKYGFNDKRVIRAVVEKSVVPKNNEFIQWEIREIVGVGKK